MNRSLQETSGTNNHEAFPSSSACHAEEDFLPYPGATFEFEREMAFNGAIEPSPIHHPNTETPDFGQLRMLIGALLLTTLLAVGSALDAKTECISEELFSWLELVDDDKDVFDDTVIQDGTMECLNMFRFVVFPVGVTTFVFGLLALLVVHNHLKYLQTVSEGIIPSPLAALLQLLAPVTILTLAWTYGNFSIMLRPKKDSEGYRNNPYKSLAAVDQMGHIGDNANLYYLSWMSQTLVMVLFYQTCVACIRWCRRGFTPQHVDASKFPGDEITVQDQPQGILSYSTAVRLILFQKKRRKSWYQFMLRLRERSGFWVAAFCSSLVVLASSAYLYVEVLFSLAAQYANEGKIKYRDVCIIMKGRGGLPDEFCARTSFSVIAGGISVSLCLMAMALHLRTRRKFATDEDQNCGAIAIHILPGALGPEVSHILLRMEFMLSLCLSVLLGLNAIFATGVQGPAATVGNLYYASWLSFLLCLRICLGCLEEIYYIDRSVDAQSPSIGSSEISLNLDAYKTVPEKERPSRMRKYFFLSIFSTICAASAWDAAYNQAYCTRRQKYLIGAPAVVAVLSVILFLLCLNPGSYLVVSHIFCGGATSIICFLVWLVDLVITMHSEDSWAVNSIGELRLANLYYFSWAAIITAGLQMMSYIKPFLGQKAKGSMIMVWAAIVKVCAVIVGAATHVWYKIGGTCAGSDKDDGTWTFCSRTVFAIVVGIVGMFSGWIVLGTRLLNCSNSHRRSRAEALLSIFLVLLFGVAVALITSIGSPGQSVGDLYYATWLAFWVCIGIFVSCFDQMNQEDMNLQSETYITEFTTDYLDYEETVGSEG